MAFLQDAFGQLSVSSSSEENLIQGVNRGDQTALEEIFRMYYNGLCRFTLRLTNSRDDVEDLVQDIFIRIWVNREGWNPKGSIKAYLFKAARNQAINFLKSKNVRNVTDVDGCELLPSDSSADPVDEMIDRDASASIGRAIEKLPQRCRLAFTLNRQEGLSYSEIADVLGVSIKTVENQIGHALKILRKELNGLIG